MSAASKLSSQKFAAFRTLSAILSHIQQSRPLQIHQDLPSPLGFSEPFDLNCILYFGRRRGRCCRSRHKSRPFWAGGHRLPRKMHMGSYRYQQPFEDEAIRQGSPLFLKSRVTHQL